MAYTPEEMAAIQAEMMSIEPGTSLFDAGYKMIHHYTDKHGLAAGRQCIEQATANGHATDYERGALKWIEEQEAAAAKICEEGGSHD